MIVLASASPRRAELLRQLGVTFHVQPANIDESPVPEESPEQLVLRLAQQKAEAIAGDHLDGAVLGSDTVVVQGEDVFGKPLDDQEFMYTLKRLSGTVHQVLSAVVLIRNGLVTRRLSVTDVHFRELYEAELRDYWQTGEPVDKAGGYAIQGYAATFINRIEGSYSGVMGLPLFETAELLRESELLD